MKEAILYKKINEKVQCLACARKCILENDSIGFCGVRKNINSKLYLLVHSLPSAVHIDPIEKKPFYHFYPGSLTLSIGTNGCNFACPYCCNYDLSQRRIIEGFDFPPEKAIETAKKENLDGFSFTYNEPTIFIEYAYDIGILAKKHGFYTNFVSNGYLSDEAIDLAKKFLDAIVVDIKGNLNKDLYLKHIKVPNPEKILENLKVLKEYFHVEVTDLIIPKYGDDLEDAKKLLNFIYENVGNIPIHFLRFFPEYKWINLESTDFEILLKHYNLAKEIGFEYVYLGNVGNEKYESTYCPKCGNIVIKRIGIMLLEFNLDEKNRCKFCKHKIPIVGNLSKNWRRFFFY